MGDSGFEGMEGGSTLFSGLIVAQNLLKSGLQNVLLLDAEPSGLLGGLLIGK